MFNWFSRSRKEPQTFDEGIAAMQQYLGFLAADKESTRTIDADTPRVEGHFTLDNPKKIAREGGMVYSQLVIHNNDYFSIPNLNDSESDDDDTFSIASSVSIGSTPEARLVVEPEMINPVVTNGVKQVKSVVRQDYSDEEYATGLTKMPVMQRMLAKAAVAAEDDSLASSNFIVRMLTTVANNICWLFGCGAAQTKAGATTTVKPQESAAVTACPWRQSMEKVLYTASQIARHF